MRDIRARIAQRHGIDLSAQQIQELAARRLEAILDPRNINPSLLEQLRKAAGERPAKVVPDAAADPPYTFEDTTLYESSRGLLSAIRKLLNPILKLFFNPNPLIEALHIQSKLNAQQAALEPLYYEVIHNLVLETTRVGIDVKNLKMRVESMSSRLDFDERRARALEGVVQYRPGAVPPLQPPSGGGGEAREPRGTEAEQAERRNRRRRRRGRRPGGGGAASAGGNTGATGPGGATTAHGEAGRGQAEDRGFAGETHSAGGGDTTES